MAKYRKNLKWVSHWRSQEIPFKITNNKTKATPNLENQDDLFILLPENVATSIVEKRLKLATRKHERNEKEIQFSIQSTGCH
ncbi:MAG: hypothetical protein RLZZ417_2515 [Bacteroidota bacterium]